MAGPRNIVLCFDGTWNSDDRASPTNVVKTFQALPASTAAGTRQIRYYDRGVGTGRFDRVRGGVVGLGLARNVELAYVWLSSNYHPGDRLFLFGYSRGAYTARSLAGLIGLCGVPDPERCASAGRSVAVVAHQGMAIYRRRPGAARTARAGRHVEEFALSGGAAGDRPSADADADALSAVHFIGVWDTVGALGVPVTWLNWIGARRHRFHDVRLDRHIRHACHAIAIDEERRPFAPTLWTNRPAPGQNVSQLWFPGVHSDVGGGRPATALSDRALLWMWAKAHAAGLALRPEAVQGLAPDELGRRGNSMSLVYRLLGRYDRPIGERTEDGRPLVTGEGVHFSAVRRLGNAATSRRYGLGVAGRTLVPALEAERVPAVSPAPGEEEPRTFPWDAPP